jgi:cytochrome c oxidase cbb3-type subunit 3
MGKHSPLALGMLALVLAGPGCDPPGKPNPADAYRRPDEITDFTTLFSQRCAGCHGHDGKVGPAPPLNDRLFLAIVPDDALVRVISGGRVVSDTDDRRTPMPAWSKDHGGPLTDQQVHILALGLKRQWAARDRKDLPPSPPRYELGAASGDAEAGAKVFAQACASCHGDDGRNGKYDDRDIGSLRDSAFLSLTSNQLLRRIIITGRPELGMPSYDQPNGRGPDFKPLDEAQITNLVALLASWRDEAEKKRK